MDVEPVQPSLKLAPGVQLRFATAPVIGRPPVVAQRTYLIQPCALGPVINRLPLLPAGPIQPVLQIGERVLTHGKPERPNGVIIICRNGHVPSALTHQLDRICASRFSVDRGCGA